MCFIVLHVSAVLLLPPSHPTLVAQFPPSHSQLDREAEDARKKLLASTRRGIRQCEDAITLCEDVSDALSDSDSRSRLMDYAERFKRDLLRLKLEERALWEAQPGGVKAPEPRPVLRE